MEAGREQSLVDVLPRCLGVKRTVLDSLDHADLTQSFKYALSEQQRCDFVSPWPPALPYSRGESTCVDGIAVGHVVSQIVEPPVQLTHHALARPLLSDPDDVPPLGECRRGHCAVVLRGPPADPTNLSDEIKDLGNAYATGAGMHERLEGRNPTRDAH
jgi:hypothetical protein